MKLIKSTIIIVLAVFFVLPIQAQLYKGYVRQSVKKTSISGDKNKHFYLQKPMIFCIFKHGLHSRSFEVSAKFRVVGRPYFYGESGSIY